MATLEDALDYDRRGWCIIPIRPGTKKPACRSWKGYAAPTGKHGRRVAYTIQEVVGLFVRDPHGRVTACRYTFAGARGDVFSPATPEPSRYAGYGIAQREIERQNRVADGKERGEI